MPAIQGLEIDHLLIPAQTPARADEVNKSPQKTREAFTGSSKEVGKSNLTFSEKGDIIFIEDERRKRIIWDRAREPEALANTNNLFAITQNLLTPAPMVCGSRHRRKLGYLPMLALNVPLPV
jgi:hypothetical protein